MQYPVEIHAPTPPTMDQNGDKAPHNETTHIQYASKLPEDVCDVCYQATTQLEQAASKR